MKRAIAQTILQDVDDDDADVVVMVITKTMTNTKTWKSCTDQVSEKGQYDLKLNSVKLCSLSKAWDRAEWTFEILTRVGLDTPSFLVYNIIILISGF